MKKFLGSLAFILLAAGLLSAAELNERTFKGDMAYYQKTAKANKLSANDRLYILNKLRDKYKQTDVDASDLYAEIDRCSSLKEKEKKRAAAKAAAQVAPTVETAPAPTETPEAEQALPVKLGEPAKAPANPKAARRGTLRDVILMQQKDFSRVVLDVPGTSQYKEALVRDPRNQDQPPVLVLYLSNTRPALKPAKKNQMMKKGPIRQVEARLVTSSPPTTKVSISMREASAYRVTKDKDRLIVTVMASVAPPAEAMAPAPTPADVQAEIAPEASTAEPTASSGTETAQDVEISTGDKLKNSKAGNIGTGSVLNVDFTRHPELSRLAVVAPDGLLEMVPLGNTKAVDLTPKQLEELLIHKCSALYMDSNVKVTIKEFNPRDVLLIGEVKNPGTYRSNGPLHAFDLIAKTGGFLPSSNKKSVFIYRGAKREWKQLTFDAEEFLNNMDPSKDFALKEGDIVEVKKAAQDVFVFGAVKNPARYRLEDGMKLSQALAMAGGFDGSPVPEKVRLIRQDQGKNLVQELTSSKIYSDPATSDPALKEGDMVYVVKKEGLKSKLLGKEAVSWSAFFVSMGLVLALLI